MRLAYGGLYRYYGGCIDARAHVTDQLDRLSRTHRTRRSSSQPRRVDSFAAVITNDSAENARVGDAQGPQQLEAIHVRKQQVEQDGGEVFAPDLVQRHASVRRMGTVDGLVKQHRFEQSLDRRIIFYDQNSRCPNKLLTRA